VSRTMLPPVPVTQHTERGKGEGGLLPGFGCTAIQEERCSRPGVQESKLLLDVRGVVRHQACQKWLTAWEC
jgi:hypothetical protein